LEEKPLKTEQKSLNEAQRSLKTAQKSLKNRAKRMKKQHNRLKNRLQKALRIQKIARIRAKLLMQESVLRKISKYVVLVDPYTHAVHVVPALYLKFYIARVLNEAEAEDLHSLTQDAVEWDQARELAQEYTLRVADSWGELTEFAYLKDTLPGLLEVVEDELRVARGGAGGIGGAGGKEAVMGGGA
jgi:exonuclease VII large subunit